MTTERQNYLRLKNNLEQLKLNGMVLLLMLT